MAYESHCRSCVYFEENDGRPYSKTNASYVKGFCTWYRSYYYPDDYCDNHYKARNSSSNGCYITTMVCGVLGFNDHSEVLETLRGFRNNVLQKDEKYANILYEYDTVGPEIAKRLKEEEISIVLKLYDSCLVPIASLIRSGRTEEAISKYTLMTKSLEEYYGIEYNGKVPSTYDYRNGGHGVSHKKKYRVML